MKAYTSSSSSSAMSIALVALGRSTTSPDGSDGTAGSPGRWGSTVMKLLREQVPAEKVRGVRAPQVRPGVHDDVPGPVGRRVHGAVDVRRYVRVALPVGDDLHQRQGDVPSLRAAADVDVRDVRRVGLQAV